MAGFRGLGLDVYLNGGELIQGIQEKEGVNSFKTPVGNTFYRNFIGDLKMKEVALFQMVLHFYIQCGIAVCLSLAYIAFCFISQLKYVLECVDPYRKCIW